MEMKQIQHEQKENEMMIQAMREQIKELEMKTLDLSQYKIWNDEQIFIWIMSLDGGRYKQYEDKLKKNLKIQQIKGEDLGAMEGGDIIDLGITAFKDKKALLSSIKKLVNQDSNVNEGQGTAFI